MLLYAIYLTRCGLIIHIVFTFVKITIGESTVSDSSNQTKDSYERRYTLPHPKEYSYEGETGPEHWIDNFELCNGTSQSPIALDTSSAEIHHNPMLYWWYYKLKPSSMKITNNGHSACVTGDWGSKTPYFWSTPQHDHYVFEQLHFHWGPDDSLGSEHTLNNQRYPLEMHMVHWATKYGTKEDAGHQPAGLRVVASLFRISEKNNTDLDILIDALGKIIEVDTELDIEPMFLNQFMPSFNKYYLTYNGSLTSPPCVETVEWIVRKTIIPISSYQVSQFRKLKGHSGKPTTHNFRPLQELNGRIVQQIR